jgi:uncharacterized heparinase superfamily protein
VRFLNRERILEFPEDWERDEERVWLYNLHYFDDLGAEGARQRVDWHEALIGAWIRDNPPAAGVGWEPHPISLRAVNWIKWTLAGNRLHGPALASLALQLRYLRRRVEWHLLANHLFVNAKALFFGGLFFAGSEADEWLEYGARLVDEQVTEQVLTDGGHFERSPMYHALALEDVLDLVNALNAWPARLLRRRERLGEKLSITAAKMLAWLETMTHPDGEIGFFNDAAIGIALRRSQLEAYANALGVPKAPPTADLQATGYARLEQGPWCVLFDAAPVGPDYQPGHAHADTLAFELSVMGERVISSSGTSTYEKGEQRMFERSTQAHNTVEVDGQNSSEIWASFRVARRARPFDRRVEIASDKSFAEGAHDGYRRLQGAPVHRRSVEVTPKYVHWKDRVEGAISHKVKGFIPLQPGVHASADGPEVRLLTPGGRRLVLSGEGVPGFAFEQGTYAREFGMRQARSVLVWKLARPLPLEASFRLRVE